MQNNILSDARIVAVYNANGGIMGELSYVIGKVLGNTHCALCDISHGNSIKAKAQWRERVASFPIPVQAVHINEMDEATQKASQGQSPVVVYLDGKNDHIIMIAEELESCQASPQLFFDKLLEKIVSLPFSKL
ncbi:hypothetical protein [Psychrobacter sp. I-STPA6b]|uniref:hypothetical protein n=1 Tax=Psychrobacter sp. I-STPA6b TaxID=2585718 RepID=UPI001D0C335B|nr:hypothetical protein [Psychrobacter sp. I-STPA6b]